MTFIAVKIIEEAYFLAEKLLFPFKFKRWLWIIFISVFTGGGSGSSFVRIPSDLLRMITYMKNYGGSLPASIIPAISTTAVVTVVLPIILIVGLITLVFTYFRGVFLFIYFDTIESRTILIRERFSKWKHLGWSYFLYAVTTSIISLTLFIGIGGLMVWAFLNDVLILGFFLIPLLFIITLVITIFVFIIEDVVIPTMYVKNMRFMNAWRVSWPRIRTQKMEIFIYFIIKFVMGIGVALFMLAGATILLIPFGIIAGLLLLFGFLIYGVSSVLLIPLIVIGITLTILLFIVYLIAIMFIDMPLQTYFMSLRLLFAKNLVGLHPFKTVAAKKSIVKKVIVKRPVTKKVLAKKKVSKKKDSKTDIPFEKVFR